MRKILCIILIFSMLCLTACVKAESPTSETIDKLNIAYQYSIAYAPLVVMKEQKLIEKHYDGNVDIEWSVLNSGSAINEGIIAGNIDIGAMGVAPVIIGIQSGIPYKIFSGISGQPYDIMTNDPNINSLSDITTDKKISVVSLNSQPHILLAMAAKEYLGDAHALDTNLVSMSNGDGMAALISGAVDCQMCISPYNLMEMTYDNIHPIEIEKNVWPDGDTFIVGVASEKLYENNPDLYMAICDAMLEAIQYVKDNPKDVVQLLKSEYDASEDDLYSWLTDNRSTFSTDTQGITNLAKFMKEEAFIEDAPDSYYDMVYNNVNGD